MTSIQIKNLKAKPNKNDTKNLLHTENIREVKDCTVQDKLQENLNRNDAIAGSWVPDR